MSRSIVQTVLHRWQVMVAPRFSGLMRSRWPQLVPSWFGESDGQLMIVAAISSFAGSNAVKVAASCCASWCSSSMRYVGVSARRARLEVNQAIELNSAVVELLSRLRAALAGP